MIFGSNQLAPILVVQWTEHTLPRGGVVGSNPTRDTLKDVILSLRDILRGQPLASCGWLLTSTFGFAGSIPALRAFILNKRSKNHVSQVLVA